MHENPRQTRVSPAASRHCARTTRWRAGASEQSAFATRAAHRPRRLRPPLPRHWQWHRPELSRDSCRARRRWTQREADNVTACDHVEPSRPAVAPAKRAGVQEHDANAPCFHAGNRSSHPLAPPSGEEAKASVRLRSAADANVSPTEGPSQRKPTDRPAGRARNERKPGVVTPREGLHKKKQPDRDATPDDYRLRRTPPSSSRPQRCA